MRTRAATFLLIVLVIFLGWRFIRPMNIFLVDERFAWPVDTSQTPEVLTDLSAKQCANCHPDFYDEWQTTIHSQAWTDPYFQTDWQFDKRQHNCRLCHTPLDKQQPQKVLSYRDVDKWDPVLEDNPEFDKDLQHEGVTCAACHYRNGKIVGVIGDTDAPHPVKKLQDPNQICVRCHIVEGERWDTFFRFPPCGTVAEIRSTLKDTADPGSVSTTDMEPSPDNKVTDNMSEGSSTIDYRSLGCVQCHMPALERPLVAGGKSRMTRQHLWRGGHDPEMVKSALSFDFNDIDSTGDQDREKRVFRLMITNTGAAHYVPTGTPDRHLTVQLRILDAQDKVLDEENYSIKRTLMWRPFIIDLWDNRLKRWSPQHYEIETDNDGKAVKAEAIVKYHLLDEKRRQRIGYENKTP
ncbi:MAG: hypothetical protein IMF14_03070, partial [Proteobacteria bacterium]|nr:hypothetical protein [Pseudomonadota bacterium]